MVDTDDTRRTTDDERRTTPWVWHKLPTGELKSKVDVMYFIFIFISPSVPRFSVKKSVNQLIKNKRPKGYTTIYVIERMYYCLISNLINTLVYMLTAYWISFEVNLIQ